MTTERFSEIAAMPGFSQKAQPDYQDYVRMAADLREQRQARAAERAAKKAAASRPAAPGHGSVAMPGFKQTEPATERQVSYLRRLVNRDPGMATTVGASRDGVSVASNLTRREASRLIDCLLNG